MPKTVNVIVEMSGEKAYQLLFGEMSSWVRRKTPQAECTGKTGPSGAFEIFVDGHKVFSKLERNGYPVLSEVATAIENYSKGKPVVEVTKIARKRCKCPHNDCACGVSTTVQKADCPCECAGQCH
ncbi:migration and invasion enhancer 1-like isoform X1 [Dendronephthya gigantea]|uniref:migration and invasion enhancer 1-like isoform X1 n=1 Tax=Dendronephthya gigantea TaxID=151771 RepID=UPI00106D9422|nr:migration and invasion enhancer 1-like isoform X1 [Dendronephthya gigantea]